MNYLDKLDKAGYYGTDYSLDISLLEYGLIGKKVGNNTYKIIYVLSWLDYNKPKNYDSVTFDKEEIKELIEESWFDQDGFFSSLGCTKSEWLGMDIINQVSDLIRYYGSENICGSCYYPNNLYDLTKNDIN